MARSKAFYQLTARRKVIVKPSTAQPSEVVTVAAEPKPKKSRSSKRSTSK